MCPLVSMGPPRVLHWSRTAAGLTGLLGCTSWDALRRRKEEEPGSGSSYEGEHASMQRQGLSLPRHSMNSQHHRLLRAPRICGIHLGHKRHARASEGDGDRDAQRPTR